MPRSPGVRAVWSLLAVLAATVAGCVDGDDPAPVLTSPEDLGDPDGGGCAQSCQDAIALRSVREAMKLAYNLTLQGKPVGYQDASTPCPEGGSVSVTGNATSNADQGATQVYLTYTFAGCIYRRVSDSHGDRNYVMKLDGVVTESGLIAVQPSSTTALLIRSDALTLEGQVSDPATGYHADQCALVVSQSGDDVAGTLCERVTGFSF